MSADGRFLVRTLSNKPSFKLQRSPVDRADSLQLLSNMVPGQSIARNVVVATSLEPEAAAAVKWAAQQLCQKGDAVHLVHVARCMSTPAEVFHSGPGNAFAIDDKHRDRRELLKAQAIIKDRLLPLVPPGVFYDVRIFADTWNAPISEIGAAVLRVATDLGAFAIVVAANDQPGWNPMRLGDVTKWLMAAAAANKPRAIPVALVRKQPQDANTTLRSPSAPAAFDIRCHRAAHMATLQEAAGAGANSEPAQGSLAAAAAAAVAAVEEEASDSTAGASPPQIKPHFEELPRSTSLWQHSDSAYMV